MCRFACYVLLPILALIACDKPVDPKGLSPRVYELVVKATAALGRANERRDAGNLLYEPRYLDAKKAVDDLNETLTVNESDDEAKHLERACLETIQRYRRSLEILKLHANRD